MLGNPLSTQATVNCEKASQVSPLKRATKQGKRRLCSYTLHPEVLNLKGAISGGKYDCTSTGFKQFVRTARFRSHLLHISRPTCHLIYRACTWTSSALTLTQKLSIQREALGERSNNTQDLCWRSKRSVPCTRLVNLVYSSIKKKHYQRCPLGSMTLSTSGRLACRRLFLQHWTKTVLSSRALTKLCGLGRSPYGQKSL